MQNYLNWKYYKKYLFLVDIKVNSVYDKTKWSEKTFKNIVEKVKKRIKKEKVLENLLKAESGTHIMGTFYKLEDIEVDTKYYDEVPKDKMR